MKTMTRWMQLFWLVMGIVFALLLGVDMLRGAAFNDAWPSAVVWAAITAAIFTGAQYRKAQQMSDCAVCDRIQNK